MTSGPPIYDAALRGMRAMALLDFLVLYKELVADDKDDRRVVEAVLMTWRHPDD